jgi:hypothetical protein
MFTVIRTRNSAGVLREHCVSVPWVTALLDPQETPRRYYVLPDEDEPAPSLEKPVTRKWGAQPRRGGREVIPLDE